MQAAPDQWIAPPTADMIDDAAAALAGIASVTPLLENAEINASLRGRLFIKAEPLQNTGAFKIRGAFNRMRQLDGNGLARGVVAYSSGNHAQAVATAAHRVGTRATIVMPSDAPAAKIQRTRDLGAEVITYDRATQSREEIADAVQRERRLVLVPPNEDARVLAGAATLAREVFAQAQDAGTTLDAILVPCGGGGLTAATALVAADLSPGTAVYGVEPEMFDDTRRSLIAGERLTNPKGRATICDAIMTDQPGALTFEINRHRLAGVLTASDAQVCAALKVGFDAYKLVIEPGAAVGLAAVFAGALALAGKSVAVIATGGNVDAATFCKCYRAGDQGH